MLRFCGAFAKGRKKSILNCFQLLGPSHWRFKEDLHFLFQETCLSLHKGMRYAPVGGNWSRCSKGKHHTTIP